MRILNTLSRRKEEFVPVNKDEVRIYACGPTVYNYIHIGNARPLCVFDVLRRYLEYRGYNVKFVQNFTDVDSLVFFYDLSTRYPDRFFCHLDPPFILTALFLPLIILALSYFACQVLDITISISVYRFICTFCSCPPHLEM